MLDQVRQDKAREYARIQRRLFWLGLALGLAFPLALLLGGLSRELRESLDLPRAAQVALYALALGAAYAVLSAPLTVYGGYILPRRYGLSTQRLLSWLADGAKAALIAAALGLAALEVLYLLLDKQPGLWWLYATLFMVAFSVLLVNLAPILLLPLFYKPKPLQDEALRERVERVARKAGARARGVYTIDYSSKGTGANAFLAGIGNTRRIVLTDTLAQRYTPDEVEIVLAHELGHHVLGHISRGILFRSGLIVLEFYLANVALRAALPHTDYAGLGDVAALPLLALVVSAVSFLGMPLSNAVSRRWERRADEFALAVRPDLPGFTTAMAKLTDQNLSEADPKPWVKLLFATHPPYRERVALARAFLESRPPEAAHA